MEILNRTESRADKRELVKKAKKKAEFAKKLTPLQKEYIADIVAVTKERERMLLLNCFDVTVQGALIENTDLKYADIEKIVFRCGEMMKECKDILENMSMEERIMSIKEIENEVAEKIARMIFDGKARKDIVKAIREEYKGTGLTTPEINIYYKKGLEGFEKFMEQQEGIKKVLEEERLKAEVEAAAEYILSEEKEEVKEVEPVQTKESKFKVTNKVVKVVSCDVTGEYGEYEVNNGIIAIKGTTEAFANAASVQNWASDKREALLKEIDKLNALENEVIEVMKEFI